MALDKFQVEVTYVEDKEAEVNFQLLRAILRRIILSDISLAEKESGDYNSSEEGTEK
jgi:hypothetical protein